MKKIRYICEAALLVDLETARERDIDLEEVKKLSSVASAFLAHVSDKKMIYLSRYQTQTETVISVPWSFDATEENFEKFIAPWYHGVIRYWPDRLKFSLKWFNCFIHEPCGKTIFYWPADAFLDAPDPDPDVEKMLDEQAKAINWNVRKPTCPHCGMPVTIHTETGGMHARMFGKGNIKKRDADVVKRYEVDRNPPHAFFFDASTNALTPRGYEMLAGAFVDWALPKAQKIFRQLTTLVSQQTFWEFFKHRVQEEEGEETPGDSMGPRE